MYHMKDISKKYGDLLVLKNINISFERGKIISILGPSGCGKTTLLHIIADLIKPDKGEIVGFSSSKKSYVFQEDRLLPRKSVYQNIAFVLEDLYSKEKIDEIVYKYLKEVDLLEYKDYYPNQLSGGMKQRVSIARAFAYPSELLLMDEPFKSLDFELKINLIKRFLNLWQEDKRTVVFITHDIQAAVFLGQEIYLLSKKPTTIHKKYVNNLGIDERRVNNNSFMELERQIYIDFLQETPLD